ncbi:MAG TPA: ABC transporter permease, partial [Longimicrobiales bacterium]|nr:ABC transporter permease [Longimicrobiales bacterium]
MRLGLSLYRAATRALLPRRFREEYGPEMEATVASRLAAAPGRLGAWLALAAELADLVRAAMREWRSAMGDLPDRLGREPTRRGWRMGNVWRDLERSARNLVRRPGLAVGVTLTIGLGIGATTTVYSVVDAVLLSPLPFDDPERLVAIGSTDAATPPDPETGLHDLAAMSSDTYRSFVERARSFSELGALMPGRLVVSDENDIQVQVAAAGVSPELFEMLGGAPALGRAFLPEEYAVGSGVAMISYEYWRARYGEDPDVLGQPLQSSLGSDQRYLIVGVLRPGFAPPEAFFPAGESPQVWTPLPLAAPGAGRRILFTAYLLGRLAPATTLDGARAEAELLAEELDVELAGTLNARRGV